MRAGGGRAGALARRRSARERVAARLVCRALALVAGAPVPGPVEAQPLGCDRCHGELELLRQHTGTLDEARALLVPPGTVAASAHDTMSCASCHEGYDRFPHRGAAPAPECGTCHAGEETLWAVSAHGERGDAPCASCHGVHDVRPVDALGTPEGVRAMRDTCAGCHLEPRIPPDDPHADSVPCTGCHEPHRTRTAADPRASVHPARQAETCGACHTDAAEAARGDAHGTAVAALGRDVARSAGDASDGEPPACSACHGAHGMLGPSHARFDQDMVERCAACHAEATRTYAGTYHGKATALGSEVVATCDRCHGSHAIFPASDPRSAVSDARLLDTCGSCHPAARPAFVAYDSHPDPRNRSRNAPLFYSFRFMNVLLVSVLGLFALHTLLWWVRITLDGRRGVVHRIGEGHE